MRKNKGQIFIIEGLWCTGKSSICKYFKKNYNFYYIQEPNHLKQKLDSHEIKTITRWYLQRHFQNLKKGIEMIKDGSNIVIERSPISSFYFLNQFAPAETKKSLSLLEKIIKQAKIKPYLLYIHSDNIQKITSCMKKRPYLSQYSQPKTLKQIDEILINYITDLNKKNLIQLIKTNSK